MIPGQRRLGSAVADREGPASPGDLYLDPDVPAHEQVTVSCGAWSGIATHVWTGLGWARLRESDVRLVPSSVLTSR